MKIPPQFQASWQHRLLTLDMGSLNQLPLFLLSFQSGAPCHLNTLLLLIACAHEISLKYLFKKTNKNAIEICVTNFFQMKNIK